MGQVVGLGGLLPPLISNNGDHHLATFRSLSASYPQQQQQQQHHNLPSQIQSQPQSLMTPAEPILSQKQQHPILQPQTGLGILMSSDAHPHSITTSSGGGVTSLSMSHPYHQIQQQQQQQQHQQQQQQQHQHQYYQQQHLHSHQ